MKKILVTGANGLLGQYLVRALLQDGYQVIATGRGPWRSVSGYPPFFSYYELDLTDAAGTEHMFATEQPDVVIHAGAMTQIDDCELAQDNCFGVNVQSTAQLLVGAEKYAKSFIFLSTDFVFDGEQGNYREDDALSPVNWYGFTKQQAESTVETSEIPWAIVRTCLVYGSSLTGKRSNIISWVKSNLEKGQEIRVVSDQLRTPTFIEDLVQGIGLIIQKNATGIFHISGAEVLTPYEMAMATAKHFALDESLIKKVDASTFSQPARRPLKTGFDITKARTELGFEPVGFEEGLRRGNF